MSDTSAELVAQASAFTPISLRDHVAARVVQPDYPDWLDHITPAAACTRPVRLAGDLFTVRGAADGGAQIIGHTPTGHLPDGVIYKACGNRRASLCPACARTYQRDAYQVLRTMLVGGKGVPGTVASHPAAFVTLTAPSFGTVHTRAVRRHTCTNRRRCDCRAEPCHARSTGPNRCEHGQPAVCWARHDDGDQVLGQPLCLDCYRHAEHVVWNLFSTELWRRTSIALGRALGRRCQALGIPFHLVHGADGRPKRLSPVRFTYGKVAEYQRRGLVHYHLLIRLDGYNPADPDTAVPPPAPLAYQDLHDAISTAVASTSFRTPAHPDRLDGWPMTWGDLAKGTDIRQIALTGTDAITDSQVAGYMAKYATKSTESTGHFSTRLTPDTVEQYADATGDHNARLIHACWHLGRRIPGPDEAWKCPDCRTWTRLAACPHCDRRCQPRVDIRSTDGDKPNPYEGLRRAAHKLGFNGHFLTKARRHPVTFGVLRANRVVFRRTVDATGPEQPIRLADHLDEETTLVIGLLTFAGVGWRTIGDAALANTAAAMARARADAAREELAHELGSTLSGQTPVAA
ncbi:plasmid replication initiator protein [Dactylosporangium vinaceum]|uniref:Replication initiator n=1 Tax=Dactylosporangium vinaceum TaxID=53362 RepID=A0ABV5MIM4_9ACTN|nr:replication initiator [Dactylosporangium vinaceum]UAB95141.1 plasmid replication initiator protein [Dactylosporangium vinaceum]